MQSLYDANIDFMPLLHWHGPQSLNCVLANEQVHGSATYDLRVRRAPVVRVLTVLERSYTQS